MQQQVIAERVKIQQVEKLEQVKVQDAEVAREKELIRYRAETGEMGRFQHIRRFAEAREVTAHGRSRRQGERRIKQQGGRPTEIIFEKGDADARAMNVKAEAYQEYNQAAVVDKLITACRRW